MEKIVYIILLGLITKKELPMQVLKKRQQSLFPLPIRNLKVSFRNKH